MGQNNKRGESPAFLITDVQHDFESWCNTADAVEIKIVTNGGEFTIWCQTLEEQAKADGQTLSEWAGDCMRANLPKDVAAGLSERPAANRPKKPRHEGR
jgi:hypothetical protein